MQKLNVHYWLAVKAIPRLSIQKKLQLVQEHGLTGVFKLNSQQLQSMGLNNSQINAVINPNWLAISAIVSSSAACSSEIITFDNNRYPILLKQISDPPLVLFCRGNTTLLNREQIAIVGSRNASVYGKETTKTLASQLAERRLVVTSGLALGIDTYAHQGALIVENSTIAVVATGVDIVYPSRNRALFSEIIKKGGCIVSEFSPKTVAKAGNFPRRNRIISGLSKGVVVIEAEIKSGSLITARCAIEQNREVFALPGSIYNEMSKGCHWLIKQGAKLIENCADIYEELDISVDCGEDLFSEKKEQKKATQSLLNDSLLASVGYETTPIDLIVSRSGLSVAEVVKRLTILELSGLVTAVPGGYLKVNGSNNDV
jgi:DNA processing protein